MERNIDPLGLSAIMHQVGTGKLKFMEIDGKYYASFYTEGEYIVVVVHDGDHEGANSIGRAIKDYLKKIIQESREPTEDELLSIISYALLPSPEEVEKFLEKLEVIEAEPFVVPERVYQRVSLFMSLSSAFRQAITKIPKDKILEAFYNGDRKKTLENAVTHLEDQDIRKAFIKAALMSYVSPPSFPVIDPEFVRKAIERVDEPLIAEFFKILLDYTVRDESYGEIIRFVRENEEELIKLVEDPINAASLAYPIGNPRIYEAMVKSLPEGSYFYEMISSFLSLMKVLEYIELQDREKAKKQVDAMWERLREAIKSSDVRALPHWTYAYLYAEYLYFTALSREFRESFKLASRISSVLPSSFLPLLSSEEIATPAYAVSGSILFLLSTIAVRLRYLNYHDPDLLRDIAPIYKEAFNELLSKIRRLLSAGRVPLNSTVSIMTIIPAFIYLFGRDLPGFEDVADKFLKTLSGLSLDVMEKLFKYINVSLAAKYIRVSISLYLSIIMLAKYGQVYADKETLERAMNILERLIIFSGLDKGFPDKLGISFAVLALLNFVYMRLKPVEEKYALRLNAIKNLIYRLDIPPIAKFVTFYMLYKTLKNLGSPSDELIEVLERRREYRELVGGDPELVDKLA